jgi:hypothetical protein
MSLYGLERETRRVSQGCRRDAERMKSKRRVKTQLEEERAKDTTKVRLSKNIQARRRAIGKEGIRRADRKQALEKKKGLNRTKRRRWNRKKRNMDRLIIALESFRPVEMNKKARAR